MRAKWFLMFLLEIYSRNQISKKLLFYRNWILMELLFWIKILLKFKDRENVNTFKLILRFLWELLILNWMFILELFFSHSIKIDSGIRKPIQSTKLSPQNKKKLGFDLNIIFFMFWYIDVPLRLTFTIQSLTTYDIYFHVLLLWDLMHWFGIKRKFWQLSWSEINERLIILSFVLFRNHNKSLNVGWKWWIGIKKT